MEKCIGAHKRAGKGELFAKHFHAKHGDEHVLPPYCILVDMMDFGMVVALYKASREGA